MSRRGIVAGLTCAALGCVALATSAAAQDAAGLDRLLEDVKQQRNQRVLENQTREAEFLAAHDRQLVMLEELQAQLDNENANGDALKDRYERNELELADLEETLRVRVGDMGEMFGVVRQVAADAGSVIANSLATAQRPERDDGLLRKLAAARELPRIEDLDALRVLLLEESVAGGEVVRFPARIVTSDGRREQTDVVRVGLFDLITGNRFLGYNAETAAIEEFPRQPARRFRALAGELFDAAPGGVAPMAIDPTYGGLLGLLIQTPDLRERVRQGGAIGYVIIALGIIGLLIALERIVFLTRTGRRIRAQLRNETASPTNPLGRILAVYDRNRAADTETLELKLDEAILREAPPLERRQGAIKVLAAVAPLLGLLGTVTGMIATFQSITLFGTGDPRLMADGISQALVTTVLGLVVAIPLVLLHSLVAGRSRELIEILEEQSAGIVAAQSEKRQ